MEGFPSIIEQICGPTSVVYNVQKVHLVDLWQAAIHSTVPASIPGLVIIDGSFIAPSVSTPILKQLLDRLHVAVGLAVVGLIVSTSGTPVGDRDGKVIGNGEGKRVGDGEGKGVGNGEGKGVGNREGVVVAGASVVLAGALALQTRT